MSSKLYIEQTNNGSALSINDIPVLEYTDFYQLALELTQKEECHCVNYFAVPAENSFRLYCCIANDSQASIYVFSHVIEKTKNLQLESLTQKNYAFHVFEREIHENFGIEFLNHPWLKPLRYPTNRANQANTFENYPFYKIESDQLHEVGVGPIHAGVIEPGHFRFICNGEKVLHLEIQLGYQHRGIEKMMIANKNMLLKAVLSESIAGDTAVGHGLTFASSVESISELDVPEILKIERCIGLELERMAVHIGDTAALSGDIAYQLGQVTNEALRTIIINSTQLWCGNRFGKGLIRAGGTNYPLETKMITEITKNIDIAAARYYQITDRMLSMPSVLLRFDGIGEFTKNQAKLIGAVGMAARSSGLKRDIRNTHPFQMYDQLETGWDLQETGDVLARLTQRRLEVERSVSYLHKLFEMHRNTINVTNRPVYNGKLIPNSFVVSLTEGWRGEICHVALTNDNGNISYYKIKDPSMHNWIALALSVRNQQISDFPICNKSFNLSYCGHDL